MIIQKSMFNTVHSEIISNRLWHKTISGQNMKVIFSPNSLTCLNIGQVFTLQTALSKKECVIFPHSYSLAQFYMLLMGNNNSFKITLETCS